ncbi:MAG: cadmium carbonic anhydrase [Proteobacteria bacterium]|nr:cadmium carbonic anhydrase [Pseudomonadota bacterium]
MKSLLAVFFSVVFFTGVAYGSSAKKAEHKDNQCIAAGPQSPRDVSLAEGKNSVLFNSAPEYKDMNLCNVHFHRNAEHKAPNYSAYVKDGDNSGWACKEPTSARLAKGSHVEYEHCEGIAPGDTIEVHWVYTTCDTETKGAKPLGGGLSACMTELCANPQLRVEAQIFVLAEDGTVKFNDKEPVTPKGDIVRYTGSTTGTSYSNNHCSPYQVNWNVRTSCETLDIKDFAKWCGDNKYDDHHAHGVRELVTSPALLSPIK